MCNLVERGSDGKIRANCEHCNKEIVLELNNEELKNYNIFLAQEDVSKICSECIEHLGLEVEEKETLN